MTLKPEDRLIVAADFRSDNFREIHDDVLTLAEELEGLGVYIKVNSALRAWGYDLIGKMHKQGLRVFADLKLYDIPETLATDGWLLREARPEIVTAACACGARSLTALREALPNTEILGVTVLTSMDEDEVDVVFGTHTNDAVGCLAGVAESAGLCGLVCSGHELAYLREHYGDTFTFTVPGIRPAWAQVANDDQRRVMTPAEAIKAGAHRLVIGRPITQAKNPREAVERTLAEIEEALE